MEHWRAAGWAGKRAVSWAACSVEAWVCLTAAGTAVESVGSSAASMAAQWGLWAAMRADRKGKRTAASREHHWVAHSARLSVAQWVDY